MKKTGKACFLLCLALVLGGCGSDAPKDTTSDNSYDSLFEKIEDDSENVSAVTETENEDPNLTADSESESVDVTVVQDADSENSAEENSGDEAGKTVQNEENADDAVKDNSSDNTDENAASDSSDEASKSEDTANASEEAGAETVSTDEAENGGDAQNGSDNAAESPSQEASVAENAPATENSETPAVQETAVVAATPSTGGHLVVIDPGHQSKAMTDKEPNGPGSSTMKMKVTGGTSGRTTGLAEYQLALDVGLKLKAELTNRGYSVVMTRESNDVSLSNVDRAQIANNAGAEAFIRIHANGSDDSSVNGAMTICQTPSNPYNASYYSQSRRLSDCVLDSFVAATGCKKQYVWETDTMTGINWANVPSTIIEMGYMTNPTEDTNMASADYQQKMVIGIANGIDSYFAN